MKWNDDKSLFLTRIFVWLSAAALADLCVAQRGGSGSSLCERSLDLFLVYPGKNDPVCGQQDLFSGYYIHNSHPGGSGSLYDEPAAGQY